MAEDPEKDMAAAPAPPKGGKAPDTDQVVDQWVEEYFPPGVITRDSQGWQHFQEAAEVLKGRLKGA